MDLSKTGRILAVLAVTAGLGACSTVTSMFEEEEDPVVAAARCPAIGVLANADRILKFRPGGGRELTDVVFEGEIVEVRGQCEDDGEGLLEVELQLGFDIEVGPGSGGKSPAVTYFVAIADAEKKILNKQLFRIDGDIPVVIGRQSVLDAPVVIGVPLSGGRTGPDFNVYVGFQLTPEEMLHNRRGAIR